MNQGKIPPPADGDPSLQEMVTDYIKLLQGPPNANGVHVHTIYGASHVMLMIMSRRFGERQVRDELAHQFQERRLAVALKQKEIFLDRPKT